MCPCLTPSHHPLILPACLSVCLSAAPPLSSLPPPPSTLCQRLDKELADEHEKEMALARSLVEEKRREHELELKLQQQQAPPKCSWPDPGSSRVKRVGVGLQLAAARCVHR